LHRQWESRIHDLRTSPEAARADYDAGVAAQDFERAHVTVGEAVGLLQDAPSAAELIERITKQAEGLIG
jgi:nitronate monooxygenase